MAKELEKQYNPSAFEDRTYKFWLDGKYFHADVKSDKKPYTIVIPPPNITGQLHMGHALDNTLQDILIRYHRMSGYDTLWLPGTDHASIATEAKIVEAMRKEGISKEDLGREGFDPAGNADIVDFDFGRVGRVGLGACGQERCRVRIDVPEGFQDLAVRFKVEIAHQYGRLAGYGIGEDRCNRIAGFGFGEPDVRDHDRQRTSVRKLHLGFEDAAGLVVGVLVLDKRIGNADRFDGENGAGGDKAVAVGALSEEVDRFAESMVVHAGVFSDGLSLIAEAGEIGFVSYFV